MHIMYALIEIKSVKHYHNYLTFSLLITSQCKIAICDATQIDTLKCLKPNAHICHVFVGAELE